MKVLTVVGARPQFVKAAPVSRELALRSGVIEHLVHSGQHHDAALSEAQFAALGLRAPDRNLGIHGGSSASMVGRMVVALDEVIRDVFPDVVLVYGDTNSTASGALAAAHHDIPIAHVEAGLRSFNRTMPEERNRVIADHLAALLFAPTRTAVENLSREGIRHGVHHVGDVMLDAHLASLPDEAAAEEALRSLDLEPEGFVVATLHRAETTASTDALGSRIEFLRKIAADRVVLLPLHPRTRSAAARLGVSLDGIRTTDALDHRTFSALLSRSALVVTDSGGVQKEAYFHRVPCITLRSETEWPETIEAGWNRLWTDLAGDTPRRDIDDYGRGRTAASIVDILCERFGSA